MQIKVIANFDSNSKFWLSACFLIPQKKVVLYKIAQPSHEFAIIHTFSTFYNIHT